MNDPAAGTRFSTLKASALSDLLDLLELIEYRDTIKDDAIIWLNSVMKNINRIKTEPEFEPVAPEQIRFSEEITVLILMKCVSLLSHNFEFNDTGLYYLNDITKALGKDSKIVRRIIELNMARLRNEFTDLTLTALDQKQKNWCALIILKMIFADGSVHPSEKVYFSVIERLIQKSGKTLADLKQAAETIDEIPTLEIDRDITYLLLKHVVAIAMFDGEYVGQEADFIKKAAKALQIDEEEIEMIIQPVASAYMVIQSLFN